MFGYLLGRARDDHAADRQRIATVGSARVGFRLFSTRKEVILFTGRDGKMKNS